MSFNYLASRLDDLRQSHAFRSLIPRCPEGTTIIEPDGSRLINFGSNDYLGLGLGTGFRFQVLGFREESTSPRPSPHGVPWGEQAWEACNLKPSSGSGASALLSGYTPLHDQLCRSLAILEQTEAAVIFPCGYSACSGTVATLAEEGDLLLSDELNHASLIDGCRLSRATRYVYPHRNVAAVRDLLNIHRHHYTRAWIVTDGVFGMDGDVAPLPELCDLADQFDAQLIVDEAHATGVLGDDGSGSCAELGVKSRVAIRIGTLSKAIGSHGGFVVGPQVVIDYLINRCRPLIFSTSGSPLTVAAAIRGIEVIHSEPQRRKRVRQLAQRFREQVTARLLGQVPPAAVQGVPIVPVVIGANDRTIQLAAQLRHAGFFVPAIRPPTVPEGTARLRVSLCAEHHEVDVDRLAFSISEK